MTTLKRVLNIATGNLDRPGRMVFARPMVDLELMTKVLRAPGNDRWRTRVDAIPEVLGTSTWATFPREVLTPGEGQLRAMVCVATNATTNLPTVGQIFVERAVEVDPHPSGALRRMAVSGDSDAPRVSTLQT